MLDENVPQNVIDYAESFDWRPADVYTLDIAEYNGSLRVIEANCFNSSGFYNANVKRIVDAVTECTRR